MQKLNLLSQPKLNSSQTNGRFADQVAIVTGGAGGIGGAIVHRFLSDGAKVAIIDLNEEAAQLKVQELEEAGVETQDRVASFKLDVRSRDQCKEVVSKVVAKWGAVHHLVNCVAYFGSESLNATEQDWDMTMRVNVAGSCFMVQSVLEYMKAYSLTENCSVVNISSISAHSTQPNRWTYAASKGAINILTKDMALDLAPYKIRVNSVSPGWIMSPEVAKAGGDDADLYKAWGKFHMSNRLGEMSEVAAAVTFLASKDASFINATDLKVDGGYGAMSAEGLGENSSFAGSKK